MSRRRSAVAALAVVLVLAAAWLVFHRQRPASAPAFSLTPVSFSALEGWAKSDPRPARDAFLRSCTRLALLAPSESLGADYGGHASDWQTLCRAVPAAADASTVRRWFEQNFVPVQIGPGPGLFTGYFEPLMNGSRDRKSVV